MKSHLANSIFSTNKIPATDIYQNHLDKIHSIFEKFTIANPTYSWSLLVGKKKVHGLSSIENYLANNQPKSISYIIHGNEASPAELLIKINNGISINIKNGSYGLYGLYALVLDEWASVSAPYAIVALRRWWFLSLYVAFLAIPSILFSLNNLGVLAIIWIVFLVISAAITYYYYFYVHMPQYIDKEYDRIMKRAVWEKIILSTKIRYGSHDENLGSPIYLLLGSTKTLVSVAASIATILSFILFISQR